MKRIFTILCALALVMAGSATALAAEDTGQSASYFRLPFDGDYRIALARQMHGVDAQTRCQVGYFFARFYERGMEAGQTVGGGLFGVYAARKIESRVCC